jgi:hypothetical protein
VGQLEAEVVALHRKVRVLEERALACGNTDGSAALFQQLVQVFPPGGEVTVDVELQQVKLVAPWDHLLDEQGAVSLRARMTLDLLTSVLSAQPDHGVWLIGHPKPGDEAFSRGFAGARAVAGELTERFKLDPGRVVVSGAAAVEQPYLEIVLLPRAGEPRADE